MRKFRDNFCCITFTINLIWLIVSNGEKVVNLCLIDCLHFFIKKEKEKREEFKFNKDLI